MRLTTTLLALFALLSCAHAVVRDVFAGQNVSCVRSSVVSNTSFALLSTGSLLAQLPLSLMEVEQSIVVPQPSALCALDGLGTHAFLFAPLQNELLKYQIRSGVGFTKSFALTNSDANVALLYNGLGSGFLVHESGVLSVDFFRFNPGPECDFF